MARTVELPGGHPELIAWLREHDLDPETLRSTVTFDSDGSVTFEQFDRDADGRPVLTADGVELAVRPVTIHPHRPMPDVPILTEVHS